MGISFAAWFCFMGMISIAFAAANRPLSKHVRSSALSSIWFIISIAWMVPFRPTWRQISATGNAMSEELPTASWNWVPTLVIVCWIGGTLFTLAKIIHSYLALSRYVARWGNPTLDRTMLNEWQKAIGGSKKCPEIIEVPEITSPMIIGIVHPRLIVSVGTSPAPLVLRHEAAHVHRHDTTRRLILQVFLAFQWWNPFMYLVANRAAQSSEVACDQRALAGQEAAARTRYAQSILDTASGNQSFALAAPFVKKSSDVRHRLSSALDEKSKRRGTGAVVVSALFLVGFGVPVAIGTPPNNAMDTQVPISTPSDDAVETQTPTSTPSNNPAETQTPTNTSDADPTTSNEPEQPVDGDLDTADTPSQTDTGTVAEETDPQPADTEQHHGSSSHQMRMRSMSKENNPSHGNRHANKGHSSRHTNQ